MLCGGITVLGFWVYCDHDEMRETKCLNLLAGMLTKAKKFLKDNDPLLLMSIYYGKETSPELWTIERTNIIKLKEQPTIHNAIDKLVQLKTKLPISIVYPLSKNNTDDIKLTEITKSVINTLRIHVQPLKYTIDDTIVNEDERLNVSKVTLCLI